MPADPAARPDEAARPEDGASVAFFRHGIGGFLTAYYVYILIAAGLCLAEVLGVSFRAAPFWGLTALAKFGFFVFAAKSLKRIGMPWVRNLHIALNGVLTVAVIVAIALNYKSTFPVIMLVPWSLANPFPLLGVYFEPLISSISIAVPLAWAGYWVWSKRVKNTYAATDVPDGGESGDDDISFDAKRSSTRAWLIATQLVGLLAILSWYDELPFNLLNVFNERGVNQLAAIVVAYPLWFAVLAAISWGVFKAGKVRFAAITSVIPVVLLMMFIGMRGGFQDRSEMIQGSAWRQSVDRSLEQTLQPPERLPIEQISVGVIPFVVMTDNPGDEELAEVALDSVIVALEGQGLKVAPRDQGRALIDQNESIQMIAESLGVTHVLESAVWRAGDRCRVTVSLIRASDGAHVWSQIYERNTSDLPALYEDIGVEAAAALQ